VREVVHQIDENGGWAVLAGVVAAPHVVAAGVALLMGRSAALAPSAPLSYPAAVDNKETVRRFIEEAVNGGRDELSTSSSRAT
jgi:hypothetical protein